MERDFLRNEGNCKEEIDFGVFFLLCVRSLFLCAGSSDDDDDECPWKRGAYTAVIKKSILRCPSEEENWCHDQQHQRLTRINLNFDDLFFFASFLLLPFPFSCFSILYFRRFALVIAAKVFPTYSMAPRCFRIEIRSELREIVRRWIFRLHHFLERIGMRFELFFVEFVHGRSSLPDRKWCPTSSHYHNSSVIWPYREASPSIAGSKEKNIMRNCAETTHLLWEQWIIRFYHFCVESCRLLLSAALQPRKRGDLDEIEKLPSPPRGRDLKNFQTFFCSRKQQQHASPSESSQCLI